MEERESAAQLVEVEDEAWDGGGCEASARDRDFGEGSGGGGALPGAKNAGCRIDHPIFTDAEALVVFALGDEVERLAGWREDFDGKIGGHFEHIDLVGQFAGNKDGDIRSVHDAGRQLHIADGHHAGTGTAFAVGDCLKDDLGRHFLVKERWTWRPPDDSIDEFQALFRLAEGEELLSGHAETAVSDRGWMAGERGHGRHSREAPGVIEGGLRVCRNCAGRGAYGLFSQREDVMGNRTSRGLAAAAGGLIALGAPGLGQVVDGGWVDPGCHVGCGKSCAMRHLYELGLGPDGKPLGGGGVAGREAMGATDVLHCDLSIEVLPATERLTGSNTMTVRVLQDNLQEFSIRLRDNFTITAAVMNGSTPVTVQQVDTSNRRVVLDRAYFVGEEFTLRIDYNGVAVSRGMGSIEFGTVGGFPLIATLSEPYFAYTWWPCKDGAFGTAGDNIDKFTLDIAITAPQDLRSVSNGVLMGIDQLSGSRRRYRWHTDYPISTYLVAFCTARYNTYTRMYDHPGGQMPVEINIWPGSDTAANRDAWLETVDMMGVFKPLYGEYPFVEEKYGVYQFPFNGGMEHQTNTGQGTFDEGVTAHELGHQWWGDNVTCRTWGDIWLNEGFATYSQALWEEFKNGFDDRTALAGTMNELDPGPAGGMTLYKSDASDLNEIFDYGTTYLKGAWVVHMLRGALGDEAFFDGLAHYRALYEGSAATTDDFAAAIEEATGYPMTQFVDQWVYGGGQPSYFYGFTTSTVGSQLYLRLRVRQGQSTDQGANGKFVMPLEFRVSHAGGPSTIRVFNDERTEHFVIPIPAAATSLLVDPFGWVLHSITGLEAYVAGPPVVVTTSPADGAVLEEAPASIAVGFVENVTTNAAHYTITGPGGSVPFTFEYGGTFVATLTPTGALAPGEYVVRVDDAVNVSGRLLDGDGPQLPSGDGLAGGDYVFSFTVAATCEADLSGSSDPNDPGYGAPDGAVDASDFFYYLDQFAAGNAGVADMSASSDPNDPGYGVSDGVLDSSDFFYYLDQFAAGCP